VQLRCRSMHKNSIKGILTIQWSTMMQPSANLKLIQCMQGKMEISHSAMLILWVKNKWQLKMCLFKTHCRLKKSFQQF
jgi:hypothetical protein